MVCNCHEDSKLLDVISLVECVYQADTQRERVKFGRRLQKAIRSFLQEFVTHMEEEESVFQPLLVENFDSKELKDMKEIVQKQHSLFREKVKTEKSLKALPLKRKRVEEKEDLGLDFDDLRFKKSYCQEVNEFFKNKGGESSKSTKEKDLEEAVVAKKSKLVVPGDNDQDAESCSQRASIEDLPEELLVVIFSHMCPRSLMACAGVNRRWRKVAFSSVFWRALYPTQWARGQWSFDYIPLDLKADESLLGSFSGASSAVSSLSSSVESLSEEDETASAINPAPKAGEGGDRVFVGLGVHLLPRIGWSVSTIILSASKTLNDQHVSLLLRQVPNVRSVNLSFTHITSEAFAGLHKYNAMRKVEELVLSGCVRIGDHLLHHLSKCYSSTRKQRPVARSKLKRLSLSGCRNMTSVALEHLLVHALSVQEIDLSGCYKIDGESLSLFVTKCPRLRPEKFAYCNDIEDGPFQDSANGCLNLECELRFCCQSLKN